MHVIEKEYFQEYLQTLWGEARRAWEKFKMIVIPGAEVTNNSAGYHILGIDIKEYIDPDLPVQEIVSRIHRHGGIAIAPHPHRGLLDGTQELMHLLSKLSFRLFF